MNDQPTTTFLGPINAGDKFAIAGYYNDQPYILRTYFDANGQNQVYFAPVGGLISGMYPPYFTATGTADATLITSPNQPGSRAETQIGGYNLGYDTNGVVSVRNRGPQQTLKAVQTQYATWNRPTVFLSGVNYTLQDPRGNELFFRYSNGMGDGNYTPIMAPDSPQSFTVSFIPWNVWFPVNGTCVSREGNGLQYFISRILCGTRTNASQSGCNSLPTVAYTNRSDCQANTVYTYCPVGTNCSLDCKGPCPRNAPCNYNPNISGFTCGGNGMTGNQQTGNQQTGNQQTGNQQTGNQQNQQTGNQQLIDPAVFNTGNAWWGWILIIIVIVIIVLLIGWIAMSNQRRFY